jgi:diguanylate cyclase (GGDEF)-like protein/PAS domain S-box-containing protein
MANDTRFERAFHVSPDPMSLSTLREGRFIDVNDALLRVTGYAREELIGRTSLEMGIWVEAERARSAVVAELSAHGAVLGLELPMRMKDGEQRTFVMGAAVIEDPIEPLLVAGFRDVTESHHTEEALRQSEARYREFIQDLPVGIAVTQHGIIKFTNAALRQMLGWSAEELHGKPMLPLIFEDDRAWLLDFHQKRMRGESAPTVYDCRVVIRSGEVRHWNFAIRTLDWDGVAVLTVATDVTERYRMEVALKHSEERYREFIEDLPLGIVVSQQGIIRFANSALQRLIGLPAEELHGKPFVPFVFEEDRAWLIDLHQRRMRGEAVPESFECRLVSRSGEVRNWRLDTRTTDWDGPAAIAVVTDVTEAKRIEADLRLAASVFEQASEAIAIADADTKIIAVNDAFTRLSGYAREEAVGRDCRLLKSDRQEPDFFAEMWRALIESGEWQGEIWNRRKDGSLFAAQETISRIADSSGRTSHYVALFSDITDTKLHQQQLERMAHYDALTGLPNRALLTDRLQLALAQAERSQELLAVCYLDLDEFKPINDKYGHEAGDRLLIEVAHRLKGCVRGGDTVARLGGDEFVLLLGGLTTVEECEKALERLLAVISAPYLVAERSLVVSSSIGATLFPFDHADADTLLRDADQAMYAAKRAGRNRYHLFDSEHDRRARAHRDEIGALRLALSRDELRLHYQPKVNMKSGEVIGVEALVRWQHPELDLLPPHAFLELAEESGLIDHLGEWVIGEALRQCRAAGSPP